MTEFQKLLQPIHHLTVSESLKTFAIVNIGRYDASLSVDSELLNSALYNLLQLREAETSSKIEGTEVTFQEILMSDVSGEVESEIKDEKRNIDEVIGLHVAIEKAKKYLADDNPFSNETIKMMNKEILMRARKDQGVPGKYRDGLEVKVGSYNPPNSIHLVEYMGDFEKYIQNKDDNVNPLVKAAVAHAYFELIHPFGDGNGRTGRLLIPFLIHEYGITTTPSFFLSSYFEKDKVNYIQRLEYIGEEGGWDDWVEYFLDACGKHAQNLNAKAGRLFNLYKRPDFLALQTSDSQAIKNLIFHAPILTAPMLLRKVEREGEVSDMNNLNKKLNALVRQGDLKVIERGRGRSPTWYSCPSILQIIQE